MYLAPPLNIKEATQCTFFTCYIYSSWHTLDLYVPCSTFRHHKSLGLLISTCYVLSRRHTLPLYIPGPTSKHQRSNSVHGFFLARHTLPLYVPGPTSKCQRSNSVRFFTCYILSSWHTLPLSVMVFKKHSDLAFRASQLSHLFPPILLSLSNLLPVSHILQLKQVRLVVGLSQSEPLFYSLDAHGPMDITSLWSIEIWCVYFLFLHVI